jgi:hypothetical protein
VSRMRTLSLHVPKSKFGAMRTADGFPSKLEASVFQILQLREKAGQIKEIKRQEIVILQDGPSNRRITWRVDFSFIEVKTNQKWLCEAKGVETEVYKLKLKLYRARGTSPLEIWKGTHKAPILYEIVNLPIANVASCI